MPPKQCSNIHRILPHAHKDAPAGVTLRRCHNSCKTSGLWHSYPCVCPRQFVERICITNGYSWKFVELFRAGVWVWYHSSTSAYSFAAYCSARALRKSRWGDGRVANPSNPPGCADLPHVRIGGGSGHRDNNNNDDNENKLTNNNNDKYYYYYYYYYYYDYHYSLGRVRIHPAKLFASAAPGESCFSESERHRLEVLSSGSRMSNIDAYAIRISFGDHPLTLERYRDN